MKRGYRERNVEKCMDNKIVFVNKYVKSGEKNSEGYSARER